MITVLATKYPKHIASFFFLLFSIGLWPAQARRLPSTGFAGNTAGVKAQASRTFVHHDAPPVARAATTGQQSARKEIRQNAEKERPEIGGPGQPEMSSFKPAGADNLVNLFTGDFNYNIPLLDVGGYPVNIFYDGSVSMEQDASWVGLGWNINPGTVTRNMRGVPDDFNGEDVLTQKQDMKPNITWGATIGGDLELVGIKNLGPVTSASLGISVNNYLGPALDLGIKGGASFTLADKAGSEKTVNLGVKVAANLNSRNGLTITPNVSLTANALDINNGLSGGLSLGTSYNSRSGIKQLQISEQMSYNNKAAKDHLEGIEYDMHGVSQSAISQTLLSASISFSKPSYLPALRMPLTNTAWSGQFQVGAGLFGVYGSADMEVYRQKSEVADKDKIQTKPLVGYLYYQKAANNPAAVMDFTRFNDQEVTPNTPVISVPQYTYDVFSIQGEGTGGTVRAYRNDLGFVRDNATVSRDNSMGFGGDIGAGHFGANFNRVKTPSTISAWGNGNGLRNLPGFGEANGTEENVYFRNPGESSVLAEDQFNKIGGLDLVRYKLGGTNTNPAVQPVLERFDQANNLVGTANLQQTVSKERKKRTQVTSFLTAEEASRVGLDKTIRNYSSESVLDETNSLRYDEIPRFDNDLRKKHHISQINVTEADGKRYVYGVPVYNVSQTDFTFSVSGIGDQNERVPVTDNETKVRNDDKDGYLQTTKTPGYAHAFLLSGLLSPDYVDVTGNGITDDDLGQAVKFNYTKKGDYFWRTPLTNSGLVANFNDGHRSERKDDKGLITAGERESWYLHSIESKTMVALFTLEDRKDGKGVLPPKPDVNLRPGINPDDNSQKRLKKIDLYSKSDLKKNGLASAKPIKTVWFTYDYSLCAGAPGNNGTAEQETPDAPNRNESKGKLTLTGIYFTYNGAKKTNKTQYRFSYTYKDGSGNPFYQPAASDRWGEYKPTAQNPDDGAGKAIRNSLYPYTTQSKSVVDQNAGAWSLKRILLPSGGQIEVQYESDDYAFVQNRRAAQMLQIAGFGNTPSFSASNKLYALNATNITDNDYVFINVPKACTTPQEVFDHYLQGQEQLAFKLAVNMPNGVEYVPVYATVADYGTVGTEKKIWVRLNPVNAATKLSPLTLAALDFLRERLPGQAFEGYDVSGAGGLEQVGDMLLGMLEALKSAFKDPVLYLRGKHKAQTVNLASSFVRLNVPEGYKYGGGHRVRSVKLKDNWKRMIGDQYGYDSEYGQEYNYETTEVFNGQPRTISSGVASWEPSIGGEENPFQTVVAVQDKLPLGPASYGAVEMPVLDAFFPAPVVGYSKVTVTSVRKGNVDNTKKSRSGIGKQVTEFYTAKDFPVYYNHTALDPASDKQAHQSSLLAFFYKFAFDSRALSQGFLVATNDMHGKLKSQSSYAEGDDKTRIHYTENFYRNTGSKGLGERFDFVSAANGGTVQPGNMGIDVELMTDTREFSVKSSSFEIQGQMDLFPVILPFWLPFVWPVSANSENTYRAVTTTKVINYHSVLDSVVVIDKGSQVSTKNLVYDAETGSVVVNRTNNEFDRSVYTTTYPAWWAYGNMGLAYKNTDAVFKGVNFLDGKTTNADLLAATESGDELYLAKGGTPPAGCGDDIASSAETRKIWAFNKHKGTLSLTDPAPDYIFLDEKGKPFTNNGVDLRIVRSGHRNFLGQSVASVVSLTDPVGRPVTGAKLTFSPDAKVLNASAVEYKEKWQADNDVIRKVKMVSSPTNNLVVNGDFSAGNTGFGTNYTYHTDTHHGGYDGNYTVASNPSLWNTDHFRPCTDHTGTAGNGNMMIVNGSRFGSQDAVWRQTLTVLPQKRYIFSGWVENVSANDLNQSPNVPNVRFTIKGNTAAEAVGGTAVLDNSTCSWKQVSIIWNSGTNTSVDLRIVDDNPSTDWNDFALDDISFALDPCSVPLVEQEACDGELEKGINPYVKGLLGNATAQRSLLFYGDRKNSTPVPQTNIKNDGLLDGFSPYWSFSNSTNLFVPTASPKWVWKEQVTRVNARGQELETVNALNVYSSALYGFDKNLVVATAANAKYAEAANESFEDAPYENNTGATARQNCSPHTAFSRMAGATIVDAGTENLAAHSGRYVLKISGSSATATIGLGGEAADFPLAFSQQTKTALNNPGVNIESVVKDPNLQLNPFTQASGGMRLQISPTNATIDQQNHMVSYYYDVQTSIYVEVPYDGTFEIQTQATRNQFGTSTQSVNMGFNLVAADGTFAPIELFGQIGNTQRTRACLRKGIYKVLCYCHGDNSFPCTSTGTNGPCAASDLPDDQFDLYFVDPTLPGYKDLSASNTCTYTKPIAGEATMLNPVFSPAPKQKMLFSAWVKEGCSNPTSPSCGNAAYTNSEVRLSFNPGGSQVVAIKPVGPVIEGWQRCEGAFYIPDGATQLTVSFVNSASLPLYVDDIRLHPFNANMKSYVYDPVNLRLVAQLDENNYATFYEYDEEGTLVRTKVETEEGVKTLNETRSFKQAAIKDIQ